MTTPFAINGLGRVGRALVRLARERPELELVAVNDLVSAPQLARLLARDTIYGRYPGEVRAEEGGLVLDDRRVPVYHQPSPAQIPWREAGPQVVVEATGRFDRRAAAAGHLGGTVTTVIISANAEDADLTVCVGLNHQAYDPRRHAVLSNASCTTHCIAPVVRVLDEGFGVRRGLTHSVHGYTANQRLLDQAHPEVRRSRAAAVNIIPTSTRAARAVGLVLPQLAGKLDGLAVRVPAPIVAMLDLVVELARPAGVAQVQDAFRRAAAGDLAAILGVTEEELVSSDFVGETRSAVVDLPLVQEVGGLLRVVAWYDNEWGYAARLADLVQLIGEQTGP